MSLVVDPSIPYGPKRQPWKENVGKYAKNPDFKPGQNPPLREYLVTPPSNDPIEIYGDIAGQDLGQDISRESFHSSYQVPTTGLGDDEIADANEKALKRNQGFQNDFIGYQSNTFFDYSHLKDFLTMHTNNIGDAFVESNCQTNTRWIERNVLDYYASLWNIDWPHVGWSERDKKSESYWGYCLTMGSTEGNMYGLWNARDYLSGKALVIDVVGAQSKSKTGREPACFLVQAELEDIDKQKNAEIPIAFYSEDAHYSLAKTVALEKILTFYEAAQTLYSKDQCPLEGYTEWPFEVPSKGGPFGPGTVDIDKLVKLVTFFTSKGHPAIVILNYGSTFKGAYDDVKEVGKRINAELEKDGGLYNTFHVNYSDKSTIPIERLRVWIHVDGALGASFMPFLEMAIKHKKILPEKFADPSIQKFPEFDFRLPFVCSINTSGHKWPGSPWTCGIYMTRSKLVLKPPSIPNYVGSPDTTFAGSRNAFSPLILWNYISKHPIDGQVEAVVKCLNLVNYVSEEIRKLEKKPGDLWVEQSPLALTIRFRRPNDAIVERFSIGTETVRKYDENGTLTEQRVYAHIFIMQTTSDEQIANFLAALQSDGAFPIQETIKPVRAPADVLRKLTSHRLVLLPSSGRGYH